MASYFKFERFQTWARLSSLHEFISEFHRKKYHPSLQNGISVGVLISTFVLYLSFCLRDRMLASAMNFAIGFFGYPFEGQYQQSITIEEDNVCIV